MKNKIKLVSIIIIALITFVSCGNNGTKKENLSAETSKTETYVCPMDTGVISDKPGTCPKCGMDLEKK